MDHEEKIKGLPSSPGVYLMKDSAERVLYVGKAKNIKRRVSSYFKRYSRLPERLESLVLKVEDIAYIPTATEAEALIYENSLIKQYAPKYNIALKDGKSYPLLKLTMNERYPRLFITRQRKSDGAAYFGPYSNAKLLRKALGFLKRAFPLRACRSMPDKVCLNYHIKQCLGPCAGKIDEASYRQMASELKLFLEGRHTELLKLMSDRMVKLGREERYEEAAGLRDRIKALSAIRDGKIDYNPKDEIGELEEILGLHGDLNSIEAFDVSNIMGKTAVGSMISFYKGRPKKSGYRKFRIKSTFVIDDYAMIKEIVRRRYARILQEGGTPPDLIVIDGGRGHLNDALDELGRLGLPEIPVIGIAKEFEHIYLKDRKDPITLPKESKALHLLQRIRDEAHRFAIAYHKRLLSKKIKVSELDNVAGVGKKRKERLLKHFGSAEGVKKADLLALLNVKGINEKTAQNIIAYFKR